MSAGVAVGALRGAHQRQPRSAASDLRVAPLRRDPEVEPRRNLRWTAIVRAKNESRRSGPGGGKTCVSGRAKSAWIWSCARRTVAVEATILGRTVARRPRAYAAAPRSPSRTARPWCPAAPRSGAARPGSRSRAAADDPLATAARQSDGTDRRTLRNRRDQPGRRTLPLRRSTAWRRTCRPWRSGTRAAAGRSARRRPRWEAHGRA